MPNSINKVGGKILPEVGIQRWVGWGG